MVTTENGDTVAVADLKGDEEGDSLNTVVAPVDVIAHEEIVGVGDIAADFKQLHEIMKLAVDVSTDDNGGADGDNIGLIDEDFLSLGIRDG